MTVYAAQHPATTQTLMTATRRIKFFQIVLAHHLLDDAFMTQQEDRLCQLLNDDWEIIATGAYGGDPGHVDFGVGWGTGFLILQKLETNPDYHNEGATQ